MKKQWFHARLYGEAFRQLKTPGILLTILCSLLAISGASSVRGYQPKELWFDHIFPLGRVCLVFLAPFFVLLAFRYAMKRRDSDFYDSLPIARTAVFFSRFAAAMTWTLVIVVLQTVVGINLCRSFLPAFSIAYGDIFRVTIGIIAANLRLGAVAALAVTFCGTSLTAVTATGLIQFLPILYVMFIENRLWYASRQMAQYFSGVGGYHENEKYIALRRFLNQYEAFFRETEYFSFSDVTWKQTLISFVIAVLVLGLALFLFGRRRGELSGQATINSGVHVLMRIGVALFPIGYWHLVGNEPDVFALILPLIFYISYEVIVVRKWKRLLVSLAWIPLLAGLYLLPYGLQELVVWYGNCR